MEDATERSRRAPRDYGSGCLPQRRPQGGYDEVGSAIRMFAEDAHLLSRPSHRSDRSERAATVLPGARHESRYHAMISGFWDRCGRGGRYTVAIAGTVA